MSDQTAETCTCCGEYKPGDMAAHSGDEHWCTDCYAEGEVVP